jgi:aspartyl-tRNA(Asn)/glutamyl-tRNA(Gln) amidotransferase subunit C
MALTLDEVSHIADLARLFLTEEELALYREQLSAILDYASRLQQVDTSDIDAASSVLPTESLLREDIPIPGLEIDKVLQNAAKTEKRQFKVPPVFDQ